MSSSSLSSPLFFTSFLFSAFSHHLPPLVSLISFLLSFLSFPSFHPSSPVLSSILPLISFRPFSLFLSFTSFLPSFLSPPLSRLLFPPADPEHPPVLSASQDWVPILDKVFGQRWCSEIKELEGGGREGGSGRSLGEGGAQQVQHVPASSLSLEPSPSSPQQDPRWTPLEDMEVFSPDEEAADSQKSAGGGTATTRPSPGPPLSPTGDPQTFILQVQTSQTAEK